VQTMSFLSWVILGLIAGFIGSKVTNGRGEGMLLGIVEHDFGGLADDDQAAVQPLKPVLPSQDCRRLPAGAALGALFLIKCAPKRSRCALVRCDHQPSACKGLKNLEGQRGGLRHIRLLYASTSAENRALSALCSYPIGVPAALFPPSAFCTE